MNASCLCYCTPAPVNINLLKVYGENTRRVEMSPLCSRYANFWANLPYFCNDFIAVLNINEVVGKIFNDLIVKIFILCTVKGNIGGK